MTLTTDNLISIVMAVLALIGTLGGPLLGYSVAQRKLAGEVLVADLEAIKGWNAQRKSFEDDLGALHEELISEREKRRADRLQYEADLDVIRDEMRLLRLALDECISEF